MNVLVTGSKGYIGTVLMQELAKHKYKCRGLDSGYFSKCLIYEINENYEYLNKDIRDVKKEDLKKDSVVTWGLTSHWGDFQRVLVSSGEVPGRFSESSDGFQKVLGCFF